MGIMVYSLLWVVQDFVHQPYYRVLKGRWCKGGGYKGSSGNLQGSLRSTRENWGLVGYLPLGAPSHKDTIMLSVYKSA